MRTSPPHPLTSRLFNTPAVEILPARLLRARGNADARVLSQARWLLRRKRDGRYLAAVLERGVMPLLPGLPREAGVDAAIERIEHIESERLPVMDAGDLPLDDLLHRLHALGLDEGYGDHVGLSLVAEPATLVFADYDRYRRPLWLRADAARAWLQLRAAAARDGVVLESISGYRSHDYQLGIFERKLARGQTVDQILTVNAAPGYSEHHGGCALDIGTPGEPPAEESFEATAAFAWMQSHAGDFGFVMSYPRNNPHGIVYEPWHWCYQPGGI